jgi:predicted AAA+ superfamily ATPase
MIKRHLQSVLLDSAKWFPVVSLTGPRQSGKTTLAKAAFPKAHYISLENPAHRQFALTDGQGFLAQFANEQVIIDEAQNVPDLFSYIQGIVDENNIPGQFILTGSQNFLLLEKITQSLAGRCAVRHLMPFSLLELSAAEPIDMEKIAHLPEPKKSAPPVDLFETLWTGFYPRIHDQHVPPQPWLGDYLNTYIQRDVRSIRNVENLELFTRFVALCAGRTGQLLDIQSLGNDCGIDQRTARGWLSVLEASFIITYLRPYYKNFSKRLIKSPKLYFLDSGLLCYLLQIHKPQDLLMHSSRGAIFESWILSELLKNYYHTGQQPHLYYYRDSHQNEIDIIIDHGQTATAVEIKSAQTINSEFFKSLEYWRKITDHPTSPAALIYGGDRQHTYKGFTVLPWFRL